MKRKPGSTKRCKGFLNFVSFLKFGSKHFMFAKASAIIYFFFEKKGSKKLEGEQISKIPSTALKTKY